MVYNGPVAVKLHNLDWVVIKDTLDEAYEFIKSNCTLPSEVKVFKCTKDSGVVS